MMVFWMDPTSSKKKKVNVFGGTTPRNCWSMSLLPIPVSLNWWPISNCGQSSKTGRSEELPYGFHSFCMQCWMSLVQSTFAQTLFWRFSHIMFHLLLSIWIEYDSTRWQQWWGCLDGDCPLGRTLITWDTISNNISNRAPPFLQSWSSPTIPFLPQTQFPF